MGIICCRSCGGELALSKDQQTGTCIYCGKVMTIPKINEESVSSAFERGEHFRSIYEFQDALKCYEQVLQEDPTNAQAHWYSALCRFGISYVTDPVSLESMPVCEYTRFDSFLEDVDYKAALLHSHGANRHKYQSEGEKIAAAQGMMLSLSRSQPPYDIFLCYREEDDIGNCSQDAEYANDIYEQLSALGYRVFSAHAELKNVIREQRDPYIFAALKSARLMLVIGTSAENLNTDWIKSEWRRYLAFMQQDPSKVLWTCHRAPDYLALPKQLTLLRTLNMNRLSFLMDLISDVQKTLPLDTEPSPEEMPSASNNPQLIRMFTFLEDGEWDRASGLCEQILDTYPKCAEAYLGKLMVELRVKLKESLQNCSTPLDGNKNYQRALKYADPILRSTLSDYNTVILNRLKDSQPAPKPPKKEPVPATPKEDPAPKAPKQIEKCTRLRNIRQALRPTHRIIACGPFNSVGLKSDGTLLVAGSACNYSKYDVAAWTDVVAVCATSDHVVGLRSDGTVLATGNNDEGQCNVDSWTDIVDISADESHTVGLRKDGTVVATRFLGDPMRYKGQCKVSQWQDIIAVSTGPCHTVGLKSDGTVVAVGWNSENECNVEGWTDIVAVSAGLKHTVGLKADGTVVAVGNNSTGACDVSGWTDIVAICAGDHHTVGLKSSQTVVATRFTGDPEFYDGQCDLGSWRHVVTVSAGSEHTLGLCSDGTVLAAGRNDYKQCRVDKWILFNNIKNLKAEQADRRSRMNQSAQWLREGRCQYCGGKMRGVFPRYCTVCQKLELF